MMLALVSTLHGFLVQQSTSVIIRSPPVTDWGDWQGWNRCPQGMYVVGMQLKVEPYQGGGDDTALNSIAMFCQNLNASWYTTSTRIQSGDGPYGSWLSETLCPIGRVFIGFELRAEGKRGGKDDTAADNFRACCGDAYSPRDDSACGWIQGNGPEWGDWSGKQFCPEGFAVVGMETQIEGRQGGRDDTALNNIQLDCQQVELNCVSNYVTVLDYDNQGKFESPTDVTQIYTKKTGFSSKSMESSDTSSTQKLTLSQKVSSRIDYDKAVSNSVESGNTQEKIDVNSLKTMVEYSLYQEETKQETIIIPAGSHTVIKQLEVNCGIYSFRLPKFLKSS